jgi:hypothetical protein
MLCIDDTLLLRRDCSVTQKNMAKPSGRKPGSVTVDAVGLPMVFPESRAKAKGAALVADPHENKVQRPGMPVQCCSSMDVEV